MVSIYVCQICALLGYYSAYSGKSLSTFRDNLSGPIFKGKKSTEKNTQYLLNKKVVGL